MGHIRKSVRIFVFWTSASTPTFRKFSFGQEVWGVMVLVCNKPEVAYNNYGIIFGMSETTDYS